MSTPFTRASTPFARASMGGKQTLFRGGISPHWGCTVLPMASRENVGANVPSWQEPVSAGKSHTVVDTSVDEMLNGGGRLDGRAVELE
jgi:hypothetical protein